MKGTFLFILILCLAASIIAFKKDPQLVNEGFVQGMKMLGKILPILVVAFILAGMVEQILPKDLLADILGTGIRVQGTGPGDPGRGGNAWRTVHPFSTDGGAAQGRGRCGSSGGLSHLLGSFGLSSPAHLRGSNYGLEVRPLPHGRQPDFPYSHWFFGRLGLESLVQGINLACLIIPGLASILNNPDYTVQSVR